MKDVAKEAGVSVTTVSMTLNNQGKIKKETRKKVLEIVKKLDYSPNRAAQSLKTKRSYTLGVIVGDISNPYFTDAIKGIEEYASNYGYEIILCDSERSYEKSVSKLKMFEERNIDGIFFSWSRGLDFELAFQMKKMINNGKPIIISWKDSIKNFDVPVISHDNEHSINIALEYLLKLGHKKIGFVCGFPNYQLTKMNLNYFKKFMKKHNLFNEEFIKYGNYDIEGGKKEVKSLLLKKEKPSAILATNDLMAIGALAATREIKVEVPKELSIIGLDNISYSKYTDPPITTIKCSQYELGINVAENLIKKIEDSNYKLPEKKLIKTELIKRKSCARNK